MQTANDTLASRVGAIRREIYGDDVESLAGAMGVPAGTWENYERGVTIPGWVILVFIMCTDVETCWLLTGEGDRYRIRPPGEDPCE